MCDDCRRAEAKDFWRACVQVRQKAEFKKTLFYLEQLLLKHKAHKDCTGVKPVPTGIDFFFPKLQDARKFVDFLVTVLPCKYQYAQVFQKKSGSFGKREFFRNSFPTTQRTTRMTTSIPSAWISFPFAGKSLGTLSY